MEAVIPGDYPVFSQGWGYKLGTGLHLQTRTGLRSEVSQVWPPRKQGCQTQCGNHALRTPDARGFHHELNNHYKNQREGLFSYRDGCWTMSLRPRIQVPTSQSLLVNVAWVWIIRSFNAENYCHFTPDDRWEHLNLRQQRNQSTMTMTYSKLRHQTLDRFITKYFNRRSTGARCRWSHKDVTANLLLIIHLLIATGWKENGSIQQTAWMANQKCRDSKL